MYLIFARLLLFFRDALPTDYQHKITCIDNKYLKKTLITRGHDGWMTVKPLIEMLYLPTVTIAGRAKDKSQEELAVKCQEWGWNVALQALQIDMQRILIRRRTKEEGLLDFIVMLPWSMPEWCKDNCSEVVKLFSSKENLSVPSLVSIVKAYLARIGYTTGLKAVDDIDEYKSTTCKLYCIFICIL